MPRPTMTVRALANRRGEVLIYSEIGDSWWGESVSATNFTRLIDELDVDTLTVRINSPGGDVFDGTAIMNSLKRHPAHVTAIVDGLAASAASFIAVGGADELIMAEGSQLMIHDPISWGAGNAAEFAKTVSMLDKIADQMAGIYARKAGTPATEWREAMREETWFTAEEAVATGLADSIEGSIPADLDVAAFAGGRVFATFKHSGRGDAPAPAILNRRGQPPAGTAPTGAEGGTMTFRNDIAARLGITEAEVTEKQILAALDEALAEQANDDGTTVPGEEGEGSLDEAGEQPTQEIPDEDDTETAKEPDDGTVLIDKAVYEDLLQRATRGDEVDEEAKHDRAAALVEEHGIKAGRLLGWQRDAWVAKAVENYDATEKALMRLAPGVVNLSEKGRGGSDEARETSGDLKASAGAALDQAGHLPLQAGIH